MLGGLYGDLPPPSSSATTTTTTTDDDPKSTSSNNVWSSSVKMAPPTLRKPTSVKPITQNMIIKNKPKIINSSSDVVTNKNPSLQQPAGAFVGSVAEEYDPARPNDYEEYKRERKRQAAEAEIKREAEKRRKEREKERDRERKEGNSSLELDVNISGEEAWKRRAAMSSNGGGEDAGGGFSIEKSESVGLGVGAGGQMTAAQRMMAKMGWKAGQGLGKQEQGITTPLVAKKTDRRAGVIVNATEQKQSVEKKVKGVSINGEPTRVVLLRNMVGPGEVDDDLETEVAEECAKYGTVTRVLIFEITEPNFPVDEAVRIFVQFERSEQATKALLDLEGRFFGGRVVRATFYDEDRFNTNELATMPGEVPGFI